MKTISNIHERQLPASASDVGNLLERLGTADDCLWPSPPWVPLRLDRPPSVGAKGGHGSVRYHVSRYEPGQRVEFTFDRGTGLVGTHAFEVDPRGPRSCVLRHRLVGKPVGTGRLLWPALIRSCHDTVIEHVLDNAERAVTGSVARPVAYPWRARLAVAFEGGYVRTVALPSSATLLSSAVAAPHLADAYSVRVTGITADPQIWADRVFRDPPPAVIALLRLRNSLVGLVGIERGDTSAFDTLERTDSEVLLGTDAAHLDFRVSVFVEPDAGGSTVTVSTVATARSRPGKAYLAVVRLFHPTVVRAMLRRAARVTTTSSRGAVVASPA